MRHYGLLTAPDRTTPVPVTWYRRDLRFKTNAHIVGNRTFVFPSCYSKRKRLCSFWEFIVPAEINFCTQRLVFCAHRGMLACLLSLEASVSLSLHQHQRRRSTSCISVVTSASLNQRRSISIAASAAQSYVWKKHKLSCWAIPYRVCAFGVLTIMIFWAPPTGNWCLCKS